MSGIYFDETVRVKAYSLSSKGGKTTIRIELEAADHFDAASIMRQLDEIERERKNRDKPSKQPPPAREKKQLAIAAPLLQLEHHRDRSDV
nr:hypothetical protein [uncultured Shinella sp.]